jgi:hypothetical protein
VHFKKNRLPYDSECLHIYAGRDRMATPRELLLPDVRAIPQCCGWIGSKGQSPDTLSVLAGLLGRHTAMEVCAADGLGRRTVRERAEAIGA